MESPFWHRHRFPRRGSAGLTPFVPDPQAREQIQEEMGRRPGYVRQVLAAPTTAESTAVAARAWLDSDPAAPPLGAAAVAAILTSGVWPPRPQVVAFADLLIAERGLRFAAEAAATLSMLLVTDDNPPPRQFPPGAQQRLGVRHLQSGENRQGWQIDIPLQVLLRVRRALATAGDAEHAAVVEALLPYRGAHPYGRRATSVLVPGRSDWVEQDILSAVGDSDAYRAAALVAAAGTGAQLDTLVPVATGWAVIGSTAMVSTVLDGVGVAAAPALFHWFDAGFGDATAQKRLLTALAALPGDEVMRGLIERVDAKYVVGVLTEAAERDPERALRLFAEGAAKRTIADLLRGHVLAHPGLVEEVTPRLGPAAAERVREIVAEARSLVIAPATAVPPLLVSPPWLHRAKAAKPVVISGLSCSDPAAVRWLPGEREQWLETPVHRGGGKWRLGWKQTAERILQGRGQWNEAARFFVDAPDDIARATMRQWRAKDSWEAGPWLRVAVARFQLDALPALLDLAKRGSAEHAALLLPFTSPEVAVVMADWLARLKSLRRLALAWLLRHPAEAAHALIPAALGKAGTARRQAEGALLALHAHGKTIPQRYGPEAAAAIETLLATDPLTILPARMPPVPAWAVPGLLPPVRLRDGSGALPPESITHLITALALSRLDSPWAGLAIIQEACEPADLAEFAWGIFHRWQLAGAEAKENWALDALGLLGDDETVRRLTPLILAWPGDGGHQKAVTGVNVLSAIGSDVALMRLHSIAQRAKFKGLKVAAQTRMTEVADALGLTPEQLADRLVPDFGLAGDGSLRLDYGTRQFVVGFDEQLRPFVTDATGKRLKSLPKPGARDDASSAPAAWKRFAALKKDVRTVAADQVRRLEQAMVRGRRWPLTEFRQFLVDHPLVWHISRRLVWAVFTPAGPVPFRIAEDRTLSTVDDEPFTPAGDAVVGIAHPLDLGAGLAAWADLFADYEILQPFPQLSRDTFGLTPEEAAGGALSRFEGLTLPTTRVLGLERRGWRREEPQDAGMQCRMELVVAPGLEFTLEIDPGIAVGSVDYFPEQKVTAAYLHDGTGDRWRREARGEVALGELPPIAASELLRDMNTLTT
ncbi:hypothetical protein AMIS_79180 [Actinoplanes missouriensis 431]|uniref:DUF4132 domain-containing protein n=1 Tax=Actinoplanes missouriensis (strain ATCC 14538 / DSM 43046 / CBS 188.64 / JCM 3121 / NBRC 102363 / NCIMB 12654 / NRRL B-3342 / UNCC 431) TaxID=512565 RepID=I0HJF1_ACTM4|nr:DUF4132 domain-containing protein [Actinoplanes missouriensis]BAL93138.1 hypothetical protein AMIS_79180 [Actinoplanes missouriensis 431]